MASTWRRAMLYLGLGPDDEYEEYDSAGPAAVEPAPVRESSAVTTRPAASSSVTARPAAPAKAKPASRPAPPPADAGPAPAKPAPPPPVAANRPAPPARSRPAPPPPAAAAPPPPAKKAARPKAKAAPPPPARSRPAPPPPEAGGAPPAPPEPKQPRPVVRPVPANAKPHVVTPGHFNNAQEIADRFKTSQPVIVNLQNADRELARRVIDFSSGLCYGLGGHMEKVANQVYLLTPANVEVSAEERRRALERGLVDA